MGAKKFKEHYYVYYDNGMGIEVSEEIYRIWAYFTNKEYHGAKQYSPRLAHTKDGEQVLPSRLVSFGDYYSQTEKHSSSEPEQGYNRRVVKELLMKCISALPEKQGKTIILLFYQGFSEKNTARILHVSQSTVSNYKRAALATLKKLILSEKYSPDDLFIMLHN